MTKGLTKHTKFVLNRLISLWIDREQLVYDSLCSKGHLLILL